MESKSKTDYYESDAFYDDFLDDLDEHPHNLIIQKTRTLPRQESFEQGRLKGHDEILSLRQEFLATVALSPHDRELLQQAADNSAAARNAAEQTAVGTAEVTKIFNDLQPKLETPNLLSDLDPENTKADAREYMARLVNHIWCSLPDRKSKRRALDYVFEEAKDGDRCFADCAYARSLRTRYCYCVSTVERRAAELHSENTSFRKGTGLERPEDERERAKKSRKAEQKEIKAEKRRRRP